MSSIMQKSLVLALAALLLCAAAFAQEHHHPMTDAEFLKMLGSMSAVGTKSTVATGVTVTVNMTAQSFDFTPSKITVNQGDTLVINLSVPSNDPSKKGHGILMETYITDGVNVMKGQTTPITIQATQDGTFVWGCNVSDCGDGHSNMIGTLTVKKITNPAPTVASIAPPNGSIDGGTAVTISGANFQPTAKVTFGAADAASVSVTSSTTIVATTPARSSPGTVPVVVTNGDGQTVSFNSFTYTLPPPSINAVSPATGPTSGGTLVTINGNGFVKGATVTVGGRSAGEINVVSSTAMTFITPFGLTSEQAALPEDIVVTLPDGTHITKTGGFSYFPPPLAVSSVSPFSGLPAGGADVKISGAGFTGAVVSTVVTMLVTAPAHALGSVDVVVTVGDKSVTVTNGYTYANPVPRHRAAKH
jgi:hypothetical protein